MNINVTIKSKTAGWSSNEYESNDSIIKKIESANKTADDFNKDKREIIFNIPNPFFKNKSISKHDYDRLSSINDKIKELKNVESPQDIQDLIDEEEKKLQDFLKEIISRDFSDIIPDPNLHVFDIYIE